MHVVTNTEFGLEDDLWCLTLESYGGIVAYSEDKDRLQNFAHEVGEALYEDFPDDFEGDFIDANVMDMSEMNYDDLNEGIENGKVIEIDGVMLIKKWRPDDPYASDQNQLK